MDERLRARLLLLAGAVLFSTGGAAIKYCTLSGWQVASLRSGIAALALLWLAAPVREMDGRTVLAGSAYAATMILFVLANKSTTAANAIFLQSTAPLYLLLLAPWLLGERTSRSDVAVMAAMALGLSLFFVGAPRAVTSAPDPVRGNLFALLSGVTWALTVIGMRWFSREPTRSIGAMLVTGNVLACVFCLPMALPLRALSPTNLTLVVFLGVFQIALAYTCVSAGLRHLSALEGVLLLLVEPVLNPVWAAVIHGEYPSGWSMIGAAIVLAATIAGAWRAPRGDALIERADEPLAGES